MGRKILDLDFKCSKCWTPGFELYRAGWLDPDFLRRIKPHMGKKDARCEYASGAAACVPRSGTASWCYFVILFDNSIDFDRIRHYNLIFDS